MHMQSEENRKVIIDTQSSKDKIERLKLEAHEMKKLVKKLDKYHTLY